MNDICYKLIHKSNVVLLLRSNYFQIGNWEMQKTRGFESEFENIFQVSILGPFVVYQRLCTPSIIDRCLQFIRSCY